MKKICVVTGSRAEYGLLKNLMFLIKQDNQLQLQVVATGMHGSEKYGLTYHQILEDGFEVNHLIPMNLDDDTAATIVIESGRELTQFGTVLQQLSPDLLVVLGDRYEILMAVYAALIFKIPVAHLCGGDITEQAYDDSIRHAITKMSHLHFTTHPSATQRVIQLGEDPSRVFNYGNPGLEDLMNNDSESRLSINLSSKLNFLVVYHPVTLSCNDLQVELNELVAALSYYLEDDTHLFLINPNSDNQNNQIVDQLITKLKARYPSRCYQFKSLKRQDYLTLARSMDLMIGNSSSGIYEMPILKVPVVNLGGRQQGRIFSNGIINCPIIKYDNLRESIDRALTINREQIIPEYQTIQNSNHLIKEEIKKYLLSTPNKPVKKFFNLQN